MSIRLMTDLGDRRVKIATISRDPVSCFLTTGSFLCLVSQSTVEQVSGVGEYTHMAHVDIRSITMRMFHSRAHLYLYRLAGSIRRTQLPGNNEG